jgi:hypothetical protein
MMIVCSLGNVRLSWEKGGTISVDSIEAASATAQRVDVHLIHFGDMYLSLMSYNPADDKMNAASLPR